MADNQSCDLNNEFLLVVYLCVQVKQFVACEEVEDFLILLRRCHQFSVWLDIYSIDPVLPGQLALKAALLMEALAKKLGSSIFTKKISVRLGVAG